MERWLRTINKVKQQINPNLKIDGILLTMVDKRTDFTREIMSLLHESYNSKIGIFNSEIPISIRAVEASAEGKSIFECDPKGKVAAAYESFAKEVIALERNRFKDQAGPVR